MTHICFFFPDISWSSYLKDSRTYWTVRDKKTEKSEILGKFRAHPALPACLSVRYGKESFAADHKSRKESFTVIQQSITDSTSFPTNKSIMRLITAHMAWLLVASQGTTCNDIEK